VDAKVMCEVCGITYYSVHETLLLDAWILNALTFARSDSWMLSSQSSHNHSQSGTWRDMNKNCNSL